MKTKMPEILAEFVHSDGGLETPESRRKEGWDVRWGTRFRRVSIEGEFTADFLRAVADYMDAHYIKPRIS